METPYHECLSGYISMETTYHECLSGYRSMETTYHECLSAMCGQLASYLRLVRLGSVNTCIIIEA